MATPSSSSRVRRVRLVVILGALSAFGPLSIDLYLPALPALTRDLGAGASAGQLTLTACLAGLAFGQLVAGPLSDRLGRRRPLLAGLAAYVAASLACALAPSIGALVALRFVQGLAGAAGIVIARAVVRDLRSGAEAARLFSFLMLVTGLAPILAPVVGGELLRVTSWRGLFVALALIDVVLLAAAAGWLEETLPTARRHDGGLRETGRAFGVVSRDRVFVAYALLLSLSFAEMFAYIAGSSFVTQDLYGVSSQTFALIFGLNALGLTACSQVNGALVGRLGPRRLLSIGLGLGAAGGLTLLAVVVAGGIGLAGILPCLFVAVSSIGLVLPNATALALADYPHVAGSASALVGVTQFLVGAAIAPLVGIAGTRSALPMGIAMAALGLGAVGVLAASARASRPRRLEEATAT